MRTANATSAARRTVLAVQRGLQGASRRAPTALAACGLAEPIRRLLRKRGR